MLLPIVLLFMQIHLSLLLVLVSSWRYAHPQPSLQFFRQSTTTLSGAKIFQVLPLHEKTQESHETKLVGVASLSSHFFMNGNGVLNHKIPKSQDR